MNDHLTDIAQDRGGASLEALTAMADAAPPRARASGSGRPCCRTRSAIRRSSPRPPRSSTTRRGGRFIVGLGAGWHEGEHVSFGIPLPPIRERFDRFESAVHVLRALWSAEADDGARGHPRRPVLPARRGDERAAAADAGRTEAVARRSASRAASRWRRPSPTAGSCPTSTSARAAPRTSTTSAADATRSSAASTPSVATRRRSSSERSFRPGRRAEDRATALAQGKDAVRRGATHVLLNLRPRIGPDGVDLVAREVAAPLRQAIG